MGWKSTGQFLAQPHTFQNCRTVPWEPGITHRGKLEKESAHGAVMANIGKKKEAMLEAYEIPQLDKTTDQELKSCLGRIVS